jgi:hypothetical protein
MTARSSQPQVRNPVLALPAAARIQQLSPEARTLLADILHDLANDARQRAEYSWLRHKAPMAAYWKSVAVYASHIRRAIKTKGTA